MKCYILVEGFTWGSLELYNWRWSIIAKIFIVNSKRNNYKTKASAKRAAKKVAKKLGLDPRKRI